MSEEPLTDRFLRFSRAIIRRYPNGGVLRSPVCASRTVLFSDSNISWSEGSFSVLTDAFVYWIVCDSWDRYRALDRIQPSQKSDIMATVEKLGGNWVIVRGDGVNEPDEISGSLAAKETASLPTREFWTGNDWAGQFGFAKQFATEEEAETYLAQHRHEIT